MPSCNKAWPRRTSERIFAFSSSASSIFFTKAEEGLISRIGLISSSGPPICFIRRCISKDGSFSSMITEAEASPSLMDGMTFLTLSPRAAAIFSATADLPSSSFFSSSVWISSIASERLMALRGTESYSGTVEMTNSSMSSSRIRTSYPFFLKAATRGEALRTFSFPPAI